MDKQKASSARARFLREENAKMIIEIENAEWEYNALLNKSESSDIDSDLNNWVELEDNSSMQVISNEISELW